MAEIRAQPPPQNRKFYPALAAKSCWLQAKRFVEAPFLTRISSTRMQNRINVGEAYGERGDAREAQGNHLGAAKLYAKAVKYYLPGTTIRLGLLEKQAAALEKAEKSCDERMKTRSFKESVYGSRFVEVANDYFDAADGRMKLADAFSHMKMPERQAESLEKAISDLREAEKLYRNNPEGRVFMAEISKTRERRSRGHAARAARERGLMLR